MRGGALTCMSAAASSLINRRNCFFIDGRNYLLVYRENGHLQRLDSSQHD